MPSRSASAIAASAALRVASLLRASTCAGRPRRAGRCLQMFGRFHPANVPK